MKPIFLLIIFVSLSLYSQSMVMYNNLSITLSQHITDSTDLTLDSQPDPDSVKKDIYSMFEFSSPQYGRDTIVAYQITIYKIWEKNHFTYDVYITSKNSKNAEIKEWLYSPNYKLINGRWEKIGSSLRQR